MKRKDFLRGTGIAGLSFLLPGSQKRLNASKLLTNGSDCVLIPRETAGPFPLDLTENNYYLRQDVRETEDGIQLNLRMKIIGLENCLPMENVRVNIWHCNADGLYSGYGGNNNPGQEGLTYLRGYQFTNANGEVDFITILPGWYNGRICHIHFQVYVSSSYSAISQLTFPIDFKNQKYLERSDLYPKGEDPLSFAQDNIFADGHDYQLASLEDNPNTGGLSSYLEVTVQGSGITTSTGHIEKQTEKVFELGQNYPNPYVDETTIPIRLKQAAELRLTLWSLDGKELGTLMEGTHAAGAFEIKFRPSNLGFEVGNYLYQLEAKTEDGVFRKPMMMTSL